MDQSVDYDESQASLLTSIATDRSKYLAINVPCLVPEGWIGDEDLQQATTTSQTAIIAPPRADRSMSVAP